MVTGIDRNSKVPLKKQIYDSIISDILTGRRQAGEKMLSTRILSDSHSVARNIMVEVYEQLTSEGYLEVVRGKGTFISSVEVKQIPYRETRKEAVHSVKKSDVISFQCGIPDLQSFPRNVWAGNLKESIFDKNTESEMLP